MIVPNAVPPCNAPDIKNERTALVSAAKVATEAEVKVILYNCLPATEAEKEESKLTSAPAAVTKATEAEVNKADWSLTEYA